METETKKYYAHTPAPGSNEWHLLEDHLRETAGLAGEFAGESSFKEEAIYAGTLHDLGKYADSFQARLRGEVSGLDHWSPGSWAALIDCHSVASALAIQGHHIGLQQGNKQSLAAINPALLIKQHPLNLILSDSDIEKLKSRFVADNLSFKNPDNCLIENINMFKYQVPSMLDVRLLYSCLTDADFIDTEKHFNHNHERLSGLPLDVENADMMLKEFMNKSVRNNQSSAKNIIDARNKLWSMVCESAKNKHGLFTLSAPTGSGKTLSMLKFAIEHARNRNFKRIILVVPFLSIIEQTAEIYKKIFANMGDNYVLEHHSLAGLGCETNTTDNDAEKERRLLSQNWDAPIIITTNVQLLESLFSNRPSSCRKLHNIMNSIIMFDEAQTLPQNLIVPTLSALSHLSSQYNCSVVFATATQPAFDVLDSAVKQLNPNGWKPVEITTDFNIYNNLRRYNVNWPEKGKTLLLSDLANEISNTSQALCIVNLKNHAKTMMESFNNDISAFHLSTNLCPLHRRNILSTIKERLEKKQECRVISTQCVESGVDIDFPIVYRALSPLDSIAQAAGRCNREGKLTKDGLPIKGTVNVFEPAIEGNFRKKYPTQSYHQATEVTRSMLIESEDYSLDIDDPEVFRNYYKRLYDLSKPESQNKDLNDAITNVNFVEVARQYRIIDNATIQIVVPYLPCMELFDELCLLNEREGINANWIKKAQGLAVSLYRPPLGSPAWGSLIPAKLRFGKGTSDEWYILEDINNEFYNEKFGLQLPQALQFMIA